MKYWGIQNTELFVDCCCQMNIPQTLMVVTPSGGLAYHLVLVVYKMDNAIHLIK